MPLPACLTLVLLACVFVAMAMDRLRTWVIFLTNLMVQEDGGYGFLDFARVGTPMTRIVAAVVLVLAPLVYGFDAP